MVDNEQKGGPDGPGQGHFAIQRIYVKDLSFETPSSPAIFKATWKPEINVEIGSQASAVDEGVHEVVLSITATVKVGDSTAFLAEVQQAGIFTIQGFPQQQLGHMLGSLCPGILFPYARETVSDLVNRGGFPPLYLNPVNFDAVYAEHLRRQQQQAAGETAVGGPH